MDFHKFQLIKQIEQNMRLEIIVTNLNIIHYKTAGFFIVKYSFPSLSESGITKDNLVSNFKLSIWYWSGFIFIPLFPIL